MSEKPQQWILSIQTAVEPARDDDGTEYVFAGTRTEYVFVGTHAEITRLLAPLRRQMRERSTPV